MTEQNTLPILGFKTDKTFETWLLKNQADSKGLWIKIFKKDSGEQSIAYAEALDVALCYGWIDGQKKSFDEKSFLQKFTPRREKSVWSKVNVGHVERLIKEGRMTSTGLQVIERAKIDGSWERAYDSSRTMTIPEDFLKELSKNKTAEAFFKALNKSNLFAIGFQLQTAKKQETRERRMNAILEKLGRGEKIQ